MPKYRIGLWWYSEVEVTAKNKKEAEEKGIWHQDSFLGANLDTVQVDKLLNKTNDGGKLK